MSSCDFPAPEGAPATGSRVSRFLPAGGPGERHAWEGVPLQEYKQAAEHHCGVVRSVLVGGGGESTACHLRYFEVAPGGFTTLERHRHEHAVVVMRGEGEVILGGRAHRVGFGDLVYVAPGEAHQLRNPSATEPFGFLCVVDAVRDRPVPVEAVAARGPRAGSP
jgi:quercetin dioxygenase-like cupin family protein